MRSIFAAVLFLSLISQSTAQGLKVPPGFEVVECADDKLANDIHCMTIDPKGRIVVAGRGYIRILVDDDGDAKAERALDFASTPKDGAMGLLWEGDTLYVTGDGGLRRFKSKTGDKADGPSELLRAMKTGGEHTSHAIRRGPDGWLYVLCGNTAGIDKSFADLSTSPIKEPIAGCVLRFQPDLKKCEIVAHGFRNPYSMDFNPDGDLFTFDADNERCVSLPWYEPMRFYHVIEGRHYGWLNPQQAAFWRRPPYFCDVVAPIATLGRGSPTGVACYRHNQFPPEYHGGFFLCDWTFGKVHFVELEKKGATYKAKTRVFVEALGDNGFAPTACAIDDRTGDFYVSIGGRGTRGAVYRIRHSQRFAMLKGKLAPLPMARRSLYWNDDVRREYEAKIVSKSSADQLRALQIARRQQCFLDNEKVTSPFDNRVYFDDLAVRQAQADLMADLVKLVPAAHTEALKKAIKNNDELSQALSSGLGILAADRTITLDRGLLLLRGSKFPERRLEGIRLIQLALGDIGATKSIGAIWEGYLPRYELTGPKTAKILAGFFPTGDANVDRELARTLGMLGHDDDKLRSRLLAKCARDSDPLDDIHYLACYALLGGKRADEEAGFVAATLLDLDRKISERKLNRDSNWPLRVQELFIGLAKKDAALARSMVEHAEFGRADHALFANTADFPKEKAARIFLKRWQSEKEYALNGNVVKLLEALPADDVLPTVRKRWGETGHDVLFLPMLAKKPAPGDRGKFIDGLNSPQANIVMACIEGLNRQGTKSDGAEAFGLVRALLRTQTEKKPGATAQAVAKRLEAITGFRHGSDSQRWIAWLNDKHPEFGKRLANPDGVDIAQWDKRPASLDWQSGNAEAGKSAYAKASCIHCHSGSQALGPDLAGVASRFSRTDLFAAILQPSKDVAARYQATVVETKDGKTYQGIVIYDAVDSLILQTGAATTVRMDGASVVSRAVSAQSLMPAGLLDPLSDREIVDLYAYLKSLGK